MFQIATILHPTDFSPHSARAFEVACTLARDLGARLLLLHVKQPPEMVFGELVAPAPEPPKTGETLEHQLSRVVPSEADIPVERCVVVGDPAHEILRLARERPCDLIVMGTHGRMGLGRLFLGSVAETVLREASCPVLTVKLPTAEEVLTAGFALEEPVLS